MLRPRQPIAELAVRSPLESGYGVIVGSRAALVEFGAWCRLAASSPHSLVHLPVGDEAWLPLAAEERRARLDVFLVRGDAGFRPSAWKDVRGRLGAGRPVTLRSPAPRESTPRVREPPRILLVEHAATLVLVGTAPALFGLGDEVTSAGEAIPTTRDIHRHGQAHLVGLRGAFRQRSPGRPRHSMDELEVDVVGHDPRYQRRRSPQGPGTAD